MNKKVLLASILLAIGGGDFTLKAQEETNVLTARGQELSRQYLRPSISEIYITDGSPLAMRVLAQLKEIKNEQFDVNEITSNTFTYAIDINQKDDLNKIVKEKIDTFINEERVGNQIMKSWFPKFINENEGYSFEVLEQRGNYAATDADVLKNNASARKTTLNELGEKLIDRSYVKVYYLFTSDVKNNKVTASTYLYKLDFNNEVMHSFYENYWTKSNGVEQADFPLTYITEAHTDATLIKNPKTEDFFYDLAATKAYKWLHIKISKKVADFKVQTPVFAVSPVRAKIGKKENVKIDDRYDVMELVLDKDGKEVAKRKAVMRVGTRIADNRKNATGETEEFTEFYKFVGGSVEENMTLVQHSEFGISVSPYFQTNGLGVMVEYRTKIFPGLSAYAKGELPFGKTEIDGERKTGITSIRNGSSTIAFYNLGIGAIKEFNFARNLSAAVGAGAGMLKIQAANKNSAYEFDSNTYYGEALARFGVMFHPNFQLFAQASYSVHFGDAAKLLRELNKPFGIGIGAKVSF